MKRLLWICLIVVAFLLAGCDPVEGTVTPTADGPTATATATATATQTPTDTPTPDGPPYELVLFFDNMSFEGGCTHDPYLLPEICIPDDWEFAWCDAWYNQYRDGVWHDCPAPYQGVSPATGQTGVGLGNPVGLVMRRPEAAPHTYPQWVSDGGQSFRAFFTYGTGIAWLGQTHNLDAGTYYVGIDVGAWQNEDNDPESDLNNADAVYGAWFEIVVDRLGRADHRIEDEYTIQARYQVTDPNDPQSYYDRMQTIWLGPFEHTGGPISIYFGGGSAFPIGNPDRYFDLAWVSRVLWNSPKLPEGWGEKGEDGTPVPPIPPTAIATQTPTETPEPTLTPAPTTTPVPTEVPTVEPTRPPEERTLDSSVRLLIGTDTPFGSQYIRAGHSTNSAIVGGLIAEEPVQVYARWQATDGMTTWFCISPDWEVIPSPDYDWLNVLSCGQWVAYWIGSTQYGTADVDILDG